MTSRIWQLAHGRQLALGETSIIMGILNVTPDSFSDGGLHASLDAALAQARRMQAEGADIIDVGGESTRPGAEEVSAEEEQRRVLPVIETLACEGMIVSVDTWRADTAARAIASGAHVVNDVWGLSRDADMAALAARARAGLVIMHTGRGRERLADPIADQFHFLRQALETAESAGVSSDQIVLDPGFGFAKETAEDNLVLIARHRELLALGHPLMAGVSRKRFLGTVTERDAPERDVATAAANALLRMGGASLFRVHNVAVNRDALRVADAILKLGSTP